MSSPYTELFADQLVNGDVLNDEFTRAAAPIRGFAWIEIIVAVLPLVIQLVQRMPCMSTDNADANARGAALQAAMRPPSLFQRLLPPFLQSDATRAYNAAFDRAVAMLRQHPKALGMSDAQARAAMRAMRTDYLAKTPRLAGLIALEAQK